MDELARKINMWRIALEERNANMGVMQVFDSMLVFMGEQQRENKKYEKALKEIANPNVSEYLSWQDDMTERGNDLNEWDWFSSIAKIALKIKE